MSAASLDSASPVEVIVVGGGMAGLAAAYALRERNVAVLESSGRPGGRIYSKPAGEYWLNLGGHMFGDAGTPVGRLLSATNVRADNISGRLLGISYKGKRLLDSRLETYPLLLPLGILDRLSFMKVGIGLRLGSMRMGAQLAPRPGETPEARRARVIGFENSRTLSQMIGTLTPEVTQFMRAFTERNGADPDDMAAGHALRSFGNVWSQTAPGRNVVGGSALLPMALADALPNPVRYNHEVVRISQAGGKIAVQYRADGELRSMMARAAIVAVPAFVARRIIDNLPERTADALEQVHYGAFLTAGVLTREKQAMPWDGNYAISTPGRRFSVLFNMATTLRHGRRKPGGSIMLFRGARGAAELMQEIDARIEANFIDDLVAEFPEAKGLVDHVEIQRWEAGAPYAHPGRAGIQAALSAPIGNIFLAGDYLEFPNMEAAVSTGQEAADKALALISTSSDLTNTH